MKSPPIPENERERIQALARYELLDTPPEPRFDTITKLVASVLKVPIALISLVDSDRQWFKSRYGLDAPQTPRDISFCGHVVATEELLIVPDAFADARFADNPLATGDPRVRFYAGHPLRTPDGFVLGTLCAIDHEPRKLTEPQAEQLALLANQVMELFELQRLHLAQAHQLKDFLENANVPLHWVSAEGKIIWANRAELQLLGYTRGEYIGQPIAQFHTDQTAISDILSRLGRKEVLHDYQACLRAKDGSIKTVLIDSSVYEEDGLFAHTRCFTRDVTERAARELELETHRRFFQLSLDLLCTMSSSLHFEQLNSAWETVLGWTPEELRSRPSVDFIHPDDLERTRREVQRLFVESGNTNNFESCFRHKSGHFVALSWAAAVVDGRLYAAARDVSELRTQAQSRAAGEARLRAIIDTAVDAILTIDERGVIKQVNPSVHRLFGYSPAELIGHNVSKLMPRPHCEQHDQYLADYRRTGERKIIGVGREVVGRRKDGSEFPAELAVSELHIAGKRMFTGIVRDISARKAAERDLLQFRSTLDRIKDAILIFDPVSLRFTYVNQGAVQHAGYALDELLEKTPLDLKPLYDDATFRKLLAPLIAGDSSVITFETIHRHRDGRDIPVEIVVQYLAPPGESPRFISIVRDLSERKRLDRMKGEFVSVVSHELRTPLTSIRGALALVAKGITGPLQAQTQEYVDIALSNSERLVRLINDILDVEKIQSGKIDLRLELIDPAAVLSRSVEANRSFAESLKVTLAIGNLAEGMEVLADEDRLLQVLTNLISNAAKFSPPDMPVELRMEKRGTRVRISVHDHGPGISPQFQQRIFERFAQEDSSDRRKKAGTGLGLTITKALVEAMRGSIGFETSSQGTTFYFELPFIAVTETADAAHGGQRILVCEDDLDTAHLIGNALEVTGATIHVAPTLERARKLLGTFRYQLVTLDLMLADGEASVLLGELRSRGANADVPVVVISGSDIGNLEAHVALRLADIMPKPVDEERLLRTVRRIQARVAERPRVLHVEDDRDLARVLKAVLPQEWDVEQAATVADAKLRLGRTRFDLVLLDLSLPDGDGETLLDLTGDAQVVIFSASEAKPALAHRIARVLVKSRATESQLREVAVKLLAARQLDKGAR